MNAELYMTFAAIAKQKTTPILYERCADQRYGCVDGVNASSYIKTT
jgi:hypothetical protein